jgi:hypothetical protein
MTPSGGIGISNYTQSILLVVSIKLLAKHSVMRSYKAFYPFINAWIGDRTFWSKAIVRHKESPTIIRPLDPLCRNVSIYRHLIV